jgi:hypothetical protein
MSRRKKMKAAVPFNAADVANMAKANPYLQQLIDDDQLRDNLRKAVESSKRAYERLAGGKAPAKTLINDKKLQADLRDAIEAIRDATIALSEAPKRRRRKARGVARLLIVAGAGGGAALAVNEQLRSKVLDKLFGSEEEFQYTPPAGP